MQTAVPTRSALQSNVDALGPLNADVGAALQATTPAAVDFAPSADGVEAATYRGRPLCSRHRPRAEAERLASTVDLVDHAVVVVFGFGLGYHVEALAARLGRAGVIIVFEPDVALLRTVLERIDHSRWLRDAMVVVVTDAADRAAVAGKMVGAETLIAQGLAFLEHPPSRERLGDASTRFSALLREFVAASKTTLMTTLIRSVDTVHNLLLNIDHYVGGDGIEDLRDVAPGVPAVVVSAGPSLRRNLHLLAAPGVRERCIIIAVQTTLKPLLAAGIRPHFVTSLDYHEISGRFFEGLVASDVEGVTLVAEAKAHPIVMDLFPGATRCAGSGILDEVLGPLARDMGRIGAGATVAHLAVYLARHLGCSPIAMIGQDLGFTDGLYYAPGTAIHEVWAPELNPFNTIEMMEWQRIVRHRLHLRKTVDLHGRSIYTDLQMVTYLQQFERDFAKYRDEGIEIIDASEGGVRKQHATIMPLAEVLERYATRPVPELPPAAPTLDDARLKAARRRLIDVRHDVEALRENANRTRQVLRDMIRHQADAGRMSSLFRRLASCQAAADRLAPTFRILNHVNQMGAFKRMRADRRIQMAGGTDLERQRAQLERDVENTDWLVDAASELERQLVDADRVLTGARVLRPAAPTPASSGRRTATRVAAVVPVDPERNGLGVRRRLDVPFRGRPVLQATLERLGRSATLDRIILLVPDALDLGPIVDQARIGLPLEIERCGRSPFDEGAPVIAAARRWADTCWRGGIGGMSIYDEVFAPIATGRVLKRLELDGALLVGPDWPLVDVVSAEGCDAVVRRFREQPDRQGLVFTQSPPGLCGCVLSRGLIEELSARSRLATVGGLMVYQPHVPQHDPIARDANVQIDHGVRRSLVRATYDTDRQRALLDRLAALPEEATSADVVAAIEAADASHERSLPQHLIVELCTDRTSVGGASGKWIGPVAERGRLSLEAATRLFAQLRTVDDAVVTFAGAGDPLLHPEFDAMVALARDAGIGGVHIRTTLDVEPPVVDRLAACAPDVVSIDLHADRGATAAAMFGTDHLGRLIDNIVRLQGGRRRFSPGDSLALGLPWIVPRIVRCDETYEDIDTFFDRWQHLFGAAVIEGTPPYEGTVHEAPNDLDRAATPLNVARREGRRRLIVCADGTVPMCELELPERPCAGSIMERPLEDLWRDVLAWRRAAWADGGMTPRTRMARP